MHGEGGHACRFLKGKGKHSQSQFSFGIFIFFFKGGGARIKSEVKYETQTNKGGVLLL